MMERADDKRESMSRKRKEGKETFSFFFIFSQNENPWYVDVFKVEGEEEISRSIDSGWYQRDTVKRDRDEYWIAR